MANGKILIVEDDPSIADFVAATLKQNEYESCWARDGAEALVRFGHEQPDAILLDLMLPTLNGLEVLKAVRAQSQLPVLVLSVKDDESDIIKALDEGADDYLTKPFSGPELVARLRANLRKSESGSRYTELGALRVDWGRAEVFKAGVRVFLTAREFEVLRLLFTHRDQVLSREAFLRQAWGYEYLGDERVVDTTIKRLRKKVGSELIETVRGLGYRLAR